MKNIWGDTDYLFSTIRLLIVWFALTWGLFGSNPIAALITYFTTVPIAYFWFK